MEQLLPVINQLQEVFSTSGWGSEEIQLPQIVVVGEQSAGKSSVLESLVGRPCLPRGKDIVTRCPIVLQLNQAGDIGDEDYCEFPHLPEGERKVTNFDHVVNVINEEVDKRAGTNKGIIKDELIMKIFSPNVVDLTVVDLPGMVKNPTGDQQPDIEAQVEELLRSYIGNPESIILTYCNVQHSLKKEVLDEMKILGGEAPLNKSSCLRKIIEKFCEAFKSSITGQKSRNIEKKSLTGVAKLKKIFEDDLTLQLNTIEPLENLEDNAILNTVANSRTLESGQVVTETAFQDLVREKIFLLKEPGLYCASLVHDEILKIVQVCIENLEAEMQRFPKVKSAIVVAIKALLTQQYDIAITELAKYIDYQASYIAMNQAEFGEEMIKFPSTSFGEIAKRARLTLDNLYTPVEIDNLMTEDKNVAERRKQIVQNLKELEKADKVLASIRDTNY